MRKKSIFSVLALLLFSAVAYGQLADVRTYDFRDGTIITNGKSTDETLTLSGSYSLHGDKYGMNMKADGDINIAVNGSSTLRFLGSQYSGLNMVATAVDQGDLGTHDTKVLNDLSDVYTFVYSGAAATLNFKTAAGSGSDLYLPYIDVVPAQSGADTTLAIENIVYYFDLRDGSIVPNETSLNGNYTIEKGLFKIESGSSNAFGYNGDQHGSVLKTGNKITLQVAGNAHIKLGGCTYSDGTATATSATGDFDVASQATKTATEFHDDGATVDFLYVGPAGTVELTFDGTTYLPYIEVVPVPFDISLNSYVQKSGTITINGTDIHLTSGATAADAATVTVSEGVVLSTTAGDAYVALNLAGADTSALKPTFSGNIDTVIVVDGKLVVTYADAATDPKAFEIALYDNSYLHGIKSYDFKDGVIITAGQAADESLKLGGNYSHHGAQYGLNMKVDGTIDIAVEGTSVLSFLGSQYSSLNLMGTAVEAGDLGTQSTLVANDLSDTIVFAYGGGADTLNFKTTAGGGNDLYLPSIEVIPAQMGAAYPAVVENVAYFYDFTDGSIIPTTTDGKSDVSKGLIEVKVGDSNAYGYNGSTHGAVFKDGNQIVLQVAGNSVVRVGGCIYSNGTIAISSATGAFDKAAQPSQAASEYHQEGTTLDFLYVGEAGTITLDFEGTTYVPMVEIVPVPYAVSLDEWVVKSGTVTVNGVDISFTAGENATANPTVEVTAGTVTSVTTEAAQVYIDLAGSDLSTYTPSVGGEIASALVSNDTLRITFAGADTNPQAYAIVVKDNSTVVEAEAGKTYSYDFADGTVMPQTSYQSLRYTTFISEDGILTLNSNTAEEAGQLGYHDASHGAVMFPGNAMDIIVAGDATVTFVVCTYGVAEDAVFEFIDADANVLGTTAAQNIGGADGYASSFSYTGKAGTITAVLKSEGWSAAEVYIHGVTIENVARIAPSNGKVDVWDFGAEQLDTAIYNNLLSEEKINAWYDASIEEGSAGNVLPSFTEGVLTWIGGGNDRLRTSNTNLTRYDQNASGGDYTGRLYVNSAAATGRYLSLTLSEDDEVTLQMLAQSGGGEVNFEYVPDHAGQTDVVAVSSNVTEVNFVAKEAGAYHIYDTQDKPSYFRVYRKDADYVTVSGSVDVAQADGIPAEYEIHFTNQANKVWTADVTGGNYSVTVPAGYAYDLSLANANGYVISSANSLEIASDSAHNIAIVKVELYTVTGSVTGLGDAIGDVSLIYTADASENKIFMPEAVLDAGAGTYSVQLEPNCQYTISAEGVNDYHIPANTITIGNGDASADVVFEAKPTYNVAINAIGLTEAKQDSLTLTFTNLNESGYVYSFESIDEVTLRDGTYAITYGGMDDFAVAMGMTSNLTVDGTDASKDLVFSALTDWSFDDMVITNGTAAYKGLRFSGAVSNEIAKGHLVGEPGATIQVPVVAGDKIRLTYYYSADFSIEGGDPFTTTSSSVSQLEHADFSYLGSEAGYVTVTVGAGVSKTYITHISKGNSVDFTAQLTVGADKTYQTINGALAAVRNMERPNNQRVTIVIDPGNYEEMLDIDVPNVSLKNAAASPTIALQNKGVDIADGAVRITSYYGHGYNYFSMGADQRWHADLLRVNKENGYLSYENKGAGTTNNSYWNTTVLVTAAGFEADHIIFENSFNQYISQKEADDVLVMWASGSKGERPTDRGNTAVQDRSYVERAAAIALTKSADKMVLNNCRVVGRQDSFFGGEGARVVVYKGVMMGAVDYLFGGMTAVFYKTDLSMNTSDANSDVSYLTAAQQSNSRGYLMYECNVTSAMPGTESASAYRAKPGYFGRPWQATTSEVVFYNTTVETTDFPGSEGKSLIAEEGWKNSLGGASEMMYEYGTIEKSGVDNTGLRADWSTVLTVPTLTDNTDITPLNFTKGNDGWDPLPELIANDTDTGVGHLAATSSVDVYSILDEVYVTQVTSQAQVTVYNLNGVAVAHFITTSDTSFKLDKGLWLVKVVDANGQKVAKILTR